MEYLIIIAFLLLLIPFWIIINKESNVVQRINKALGALTANILRIPQGLFYSKNHTWTYLEKSGNAKTGLDDFLLQVVGDVNVGLLKLPGEKIRKGDPIAEIDQNGKRLRIFSPISGQIVNTNSLLNENPEILNQDPYELGWIYTIHPTNWVAETASYYLAGEANKWIKKELERFKDFLAVSVAKHSPEPSLIAFQEGGEIRQNVLSELDEKIWEDFQESFLD
jgi:glycine cleavage system H protein